MSILALDYGTKRIGVAVSDPTLTLARTLPFLPQEAFPKVVTALKKVISSEQVSLILVGLPRNMDGSYGPAAEKVEAFVRDLECALGMPIKKVDERLTTVMASRLLQESGQDTRKQKKTIDSASAAVMLQAYLDAQSPPLLMPEPDDEDLESGR